MQTISTLKLDSGKRKEFELILGRHSLRLGKTTKVMGILNLTCDSFSKDGIYKDPERAKELSLQMAVIVEVVTPPES